MTKPAVYHLEISMAEYNLPEIVESIIYIGADINDQDDENRTPLHLAVKNNQYNYAKALIDKGADIMVK